MDPFDATVYAFSNDSDQATAHHAALAELLDGLSADRVGRLLALDGKRCLEVGAGGGSFARWLAAHVGPTGMVLATDLNPIAGPTHPRLTLIAHDITCEPIPEAGSYDLIHARLLLNHLPQRRAVLASLAAALAPGGVLLTEDWWSEPASTFVAFAEDLQDTLLLRDFHQAVLAVLDAHGNDREWCMQALGAMRDEGLTETDTRVTAKTWPGNGAGARLLTATLAQLRAELVDIGGLDPGQLDRVQVLLADPQVVFHGHRLYSTSGRKPFH